MSTPPTSAAFVFQPNSSPVFMDPVCLMEHDAPGLPDDSFDSSGRGVLVFPPSFDRTGFSGGARQVPRHAQLPMPSQRHSGFFCLDSRRQFDSDSASESVEKARPPRQNLRAEVLNDPLLNAAPTMMPMMPVTCNQKLGHIGGLESASEPFVWQGLPPALGFPSDLIEAGEISSAGVCSDSRDQGNSLQLQPDGAEGATGPIDFLDSYGIDNWGHAAAGTKHSSGAHEHPRMSKIGQVSPKMLQVGGGASGSVAGREADRYGMRLPSSSEPFPGRRFASPQPAAKPGHVLSMPDASEPASHFWLEETRAGCFSGGAVYDTAAPFDEAAGGDRLHLVESKAWCAETAASGGTAVDANDAASHRPVPVSNEGPHRSNAASVGSETADADRKLGRRGKQPMAQSEGRDTPHDDNLKDLRKIRKREVARKRYHDQQTYIHSVESEVQNLIKVHKQLNDELRDLKEQKEGLLQREQDLKAALKVFNSERRFLKCSIEEKEAETRRLRQHIN